MAHAPIARAVFLLALGLGATLAWGQAPTIAAFTPISAQVGATVTISGTGFKKVTAVQFSNTPATFKVVNATSITATVPAVCEHALITVTTRHGSATSARTFNLLVLNPKDGAPMVYVPAGEFRMGSGADEHNVTLDGYWMYQSPVTVAQYWIFCEATNRPMAKEPSWKFYMDHPVVYVTWDDAVAYARWAGAALPSEAQWEKAARGTDGRAYPWGNEWNYKLCVHGVPPFRKGSTMKVLRYPGGASPYGADAMAGNTWEWCADWYQANYDKTSPAHNPTGPATGSARVLRGGSWHDTKPEYFTTTFRYKLPPTASNMCTGFRCVVPDMVK